MKKKIIGTVAMATAAMGLCVYAASVNTDDVRKAESNAAQALYAESVMVGDENGNLNLEDTVTRAEFVMLMYKAGCFDAVEKERFSVDFSDLSNEHWAYDAINKAYNANAVSGFEDETFRPDVPVKYEQAMRMVMGRFVTDAEYPIGYIGEAIERGISDNVQGEIGENLTRGNAAILIDNYLEYKEANPGEELAWVFKGDDTDDGYDNFTIYEDVAMESVEINKAMASTSGGAGGGGSAAGGYPMTYAPVYNSEEYEGEEENIFKKTLTSPMSTFSVDVDTASYSNMRRFLTWGNMPEDGAIRTEELINYFDYELPQPEGDVPFSVTTEIHPCPWNENNRLAMISLKGKELSEYEAAANNLVFLIDVSGSMFSANKLPLVQRSLDLLLDNLDERDTISIVTYAGNAGVALEPTPGTEKQKIKDAIYALNAGGSTAGAQGIVTAYDLAEKHKTDGNNRIILCTDGDFNVGTTNNQTLEELISEKKETGIFLTVLGFGMGNYKDNRMEMLADCGNGNYAYIDTFKEAKKVLADDLDKTLYTIAKDVKIQVEFNPAKVAEYRLVGYENRLLENEDFENDQKDAGEIGAGHSVTVFYEIVPSDGTETSDLRYQESVTKDSNELMFVKIRYKEPDGVESKLTEYPVMSEDSENVSENFLFASAVAEFGMLMNDSEFIGTGNYKQVKERAKAGVGEDRFGIRNEFIQLADIAEYLDRKEK